jgi:hypothetical protein
VIHDDLSGVALDLDHAQYRIVLGEATRSDHPDMTGWQKDIITLGFQRVDPTNGSSPFGVQLMSSLMTSGKYDTGFLREYGDALISREAAMESPGSGWAAHGGGYVPLLGEDFRWDPITGFMEALSRDPEAATTVFADADRSEYLLKDRPYGNLPVEGGAEGGLAARHAIGEALLAAASGIDPNDPAATFVEHTPEHGEVVGNALQQLSAMGNDFPPEFRQPTSRVLTNHAPAVMDAINARRGASAPLDREELYKVMTQTSRDEVAYGILNEGMSIEMLRQISEPGDVSVDGRPQDGAEKSLIHAGRTVGVLEQARYSAFSLEMERDRSVQRMAMYHGLGSALNLIPDIGDVLQRSADLVITSWMEDELRREGEQLSTQHSAEFTARGNQLTTLANEWAKTHLGTSEAPEEWDSMIKLHALLGNRA